MMKTTRWTTRDQECNVTNEEAKCTDSQIKAVMLGNGVLSRCVRIVLSKASSRTRRLLRLLLNGTQRDFRKTRLLNV